MNPRVIARICAAVGVVAAVSILGAPTQAHHSIDFDNHNCGTATPSPDIEPDLTPPPTEPPDGESPPGTDESTPAPQNCMPTSGERIWGTRAIKFSTSTTSAHPLKRVSLYIMSEEEHIPSAMDGKDLLGTDGEGVTFTEDERRTSYPCDPEEDAGCNDAQAFQWNSREITPYNGIYKIRVVVETYDSPLGTSRGHTSSLERKDLRVDNAPLSTGAPAIVATTLNSVTMNWAPAVEPDVLGYTVYRAVTEDSKKPPYGAFKQLGSSTGPSFRDAKATPGFQWYAVSVTRRSVVTPDKGITSALGPISTGAEVLSPEDLEKDSDKGTRRPISFRDLTQHRPTSRLAAVADAPFAYKLPYDPNAPENDSAVEGSRSEGGSDPRGPVLPVAVGMFLVSSALAVGRMPY